MVYGKLLVSSGWDYNADIDRMTDKLLMKVIPANLYLRPISIMYHEITAQPHGISYFSNYKENTRYMNESTDENLMKKKEKQNIKIYITRPKNARAHR